MSPSPPPGISCPPRKGAESPLTTLLNMINPFVKMREKASAHLCALGQSGQLYYLHVGTDANELFEKASLGGIAGVTVTPNPAKYETAIAFTANGSPHAWALLAYPIGGDYSPEERAGFQGLHDQVVAKFRS